MHRCFRQVKHNHVVAGVDVLCCKPLYCVFLMARHSEIKAVQPTLRDLVRETGSALNVWLVPHMPLVDASFSHYSCHGIYNGCWQL
jgi:hypothetical protein